MSDKVPWKKRRVLVVDDSAFIRSLLTHQLEEIGVEVVQACNGDEAMDYAYIEDFDLIVTDVVMPGMDGLELCSKLRNNPSTQHIPIIILSNLDDEADIERGFLAGASLYISKAEVKTGILESIGKVLSKAATQQEQLIMVVEDSPTIRSAVETGLREVGFKVVTAEHGAKAMELLTSRAPDLILSDIDMPYMNGEEFCRLVHATPAFSPIPFVVMSASSDRPIMRRMLNLGADAYIVKPFNIDQLVILVEKLLSDRLLLLSKEKEGLENERSLILASITSLCCALEARDPYTRGHSEAVAEIAVRIANCMNVKSDEIDVIKLGGRLHDIGKIGILDSVLLKPGDLSEVEYDIIRRHPVIGAEILRPVPSLSKIIPLVLHHHERFDGKGYPDRLAGFSIPLWARITAVSDTFHALTSDRPYRKGMVLEKALQIIKKASGTQLCPDCVSAFLDNRLWEKSQPPVETLVATAHSLVKPIVRR
jgi:putative two-component system response regulator